MPSPISPLTISRDLDPHAAKGPLEKLTKNSFASSDLRYPIDLGSNNFEGLHYITFYINVQEKSQYNVSERTGVGPTINSNREADAAAGIGQLATEGVGFFGSLVAGAAFGAAAGEIGGELGFALGGPAGAVTGAVGGGVLGGALGTAVVESINLSRKTKRISSSISLYMPDTINQQIIHEYGEISMTDALGMVGAIGQGASSVGASVEGYFNETFGDGTKVNLKGAGVGSLAELGGTLAEKSGVFGPGIKEAILFSAGLALNPQVEILYQKTGHREFLFDFKMIARSEAEAAAIRKIIKEFKFHSAPELLPGSQGRFFIPPAEFDIKFFYNGAENTNIHKISSCVLVGIDVNYASAGQWTTFDDGMPVEVSMQLRFKELELIHKARVQEGY